MSKKVNVVVSLKSQGQQTVKSESFRQSKKSIGPDPTFLTVLSDFFVYTVSDLFFFFTFSSCFPLFLNVDFYLPLLCFYIYICILYFLSSFLTCIRAFLWLWLFHLTSSWHVFDFFKSMILVLPYYDLHRLIQSKCIRSAEWWGRFVFVL